MKRLLLILAIFAAMAALCVVEIIYTSKFYSNEIELLNKVEIEFNIDPENISRKESAEAFDAAFKEWEKNKNRLMMLANHNTVKFVDEKIISLKELIRMNQQYDAYVALKTAIGYLEDLQSESLPKLANLL